jgi:hypothetical protein
LIQPAYKIDNKNNTPLEDFIYDEQEMHAKILG